ncbi:hypothetical protein [Microcoleus sp. D3_18a_C4]|uniref:hypothetical protein n=1 Tax=Microcoleus sp. D3_18a_C4 TaxID=3055332 RepID=UPI002FD2773D
MTLESDCQQGRSKDFIFSRRGVLQGLASIVLPFLVPRTQPCSLYPSPEFKMGDLVAYDWEPDDDDALEVATDFGEILGMRWVPEPDGYCMIGNAWVYFIRWTHSTCPGILSKPCYDGEPTYSFDLRLIKHG